MIDLAALCGQRIELRVLEPAAGPGAGRARRRGRRARGGRAARRNVGEVLVHRFEHAIVRDTVEAGITGRRRARLHLQLADAIESAYEADRRPVLAELARHFAAAVPMGRRDKAVYYGRRAAPRRCGRRPTTRPSPTSTSCSA